MNFGAVMGNIESAVDHISVKAKERFAMTVLSVIVILATGWAARDFVSMILKDGPAVEILQYELEKSIVAPGEPLRVKVVTVRNRYCPITMSQRDVVDTDIQASVWYETVKLPQTPIGKRDERTFVIRIGLHPQGAYELQATWQDHCDSGTYTHPLERLPFRIALPPRVAPPITGGIDRWDSMRN